MFANLLVLVLLTTASANDITDAVFGNASRGSVPAAFGDFNSDKLTDIFVIHDDGHTINVLLAGTKEPIMQPSNLTCHFNKGSITSVVPGDFDGDAVMDILVTTLDKELNTSVFILWGAQDSIECPSDESRPIISTKDQPLVLDYNQDMIADLFGTTPDGQRIFWIFGPNRTAPRQHVMEHKGSKLRYPHSHAFLDLDGDFVSDLVLTTVKGFEVWHGLENGEGFVYNHSLNYPDGVKEDNVGQSLFLDISLNSHLELVLPVCFGKNCENSTIFIYDGHQWRDLRPNFKDSQGNTWGFVEHDGGKFTDVITVRGGDFNLDGYPDLLATLKYQKAIRTVLLENVQGTNGRTFSVQWNSLGGSNFTVAGAFFDFYQKGTLDVLLVQRLNDGNTALKAFKNGLDYDANFLKTVNISNDKATKQLEIECNQISIKDEYPTHKAGINPDDIFLQSPHRHEVYKMMLDQMIFKGVKLSEKNTPVALQVEWSPYKIQGLGSVLAIRSSSGAVVLYIRKFNKWKEYEDLAVKRHQVVERTWDRSNKSFDELQVRVDQLKATTISWCPGESKEEAILTVAYGDNSVISWKISQSDSSVYKSLAFKTMKQITNLSMHFGSNSSSSFILIGDTMGTVSLYFFESNRTVEIWEEQDMIPVVDSIIFPHVNNAWILVAVKGSCLVASTFNVDGQVLQIGIKNFETMGITGLIHLEANKFLLSHLCGQVEEVTLILSSDMIEFAQCLFPHKLNIKDCNLHGFGLSKNGIIYAITQSVFVPHDHLILREPSRVVFFTFTPSSNILPMVRSIESNAGLGDIWDLVELIRMNIDPSVWQGKAQIEEIRKNQVLHRRLMYLCLADAQRNECPMDEISLIKNRLEELDKEILARHILKTLLQLPPTMSSNESCSVILMKMWLKNYTSCHQDTFSQEELSSTIGTFTEINVTEACSICGDEVEFSESLEMVCGRGHQLPRCCLSLLQCNTPPYRVCQVCNLCCLEKPLFGQEPICLLCKMPMVTEDYFE